MEINDISPSITSNQGVGSMAVSDTFPSPKMRLLQGDAFTPSTEDMQGNRMVVKNGPNAGQPTQAFVLTCGIAKSDPEAIPYIMKLAAIAAKAKPALWPQGVKAPPANFPPQYVQTVAQLFGCSHPQFALKVQDGDGFDGNGKPNSTKQGHAGHWIIKFSQPSAPEVYEDGKISPLQRVDIDKAKHSLLKTGYYIKIGAQVSDNENDQRPGLYLNPKFVVIMHAGEEIRSGPDAATVMGGGAPQTIDHSSTPVLVMTGTYTYETLKAAGWSDEQMIAAGHAVRNEAPPPPPIITTPPPPVSSTPVMLTGHSYETLKAAGWSDEQMIAAGHMAAPVVAPPIPPSSATPPPAPPVPTPGASTPPVPVPPGATPSPSSVPPPPYSGFREVPPARVMLPAAQGATYEQLIEKGWTDAQLIQHGMMQA